MSLGSTVARLGKSETARPLRRLLRPILSHWSRPIAAKLRTGHTCYVDLRSVVGQGLLVTGRMDPKLGDWISDAVAGRDGIFIDAGANVGYFSLLALSKMRNGTAHAFEIDPRTLRCLHLTQSRGNVTNLVIHECGLGAATATAGLVSEEELVWTHVDFSATRGPRFTIQPLDSFAPEFAGQAVVAMKIDIEGMELAAVQGAREILAKHRPLVVSEAIDVNMARYGSSVREYKEFMATLGYAHRELQGTDDNTLVFTPEAI